MGLIDADKLIQELETDRLKILAKYHEEDYDPYYGGVLSAIQEVIKNIGKQQSYDVDKVVEQLEEKLKLTNEEKRKARTNIYEYGKAQGRAEGINIAIEIVKAGGVNE